MPTVVNGLTKLNANMASSDASELPSAPFSMADLLREQPQSESSHVIDPDVLDLQESTYKESFESSDDPDGVNAAEWLAYWNMSPNPQDPLPMMSLSTEKMSVQSSPSEFAGSSFQDSVYNTLMQESSLADESLSDGMMGNPRPLEFLSSTMIASSTIEPKTLGSAKIAPTLQANANTAIQPSLDSVTPITESQASMQYNEIAEETTIMQPMMQEIVSKGQIIADEEAPKKPIDLKNSIDGQIQPVDTPQVRRPEPTYAASDLFPEYESVVKPHEVEALSLNSNNAELNQSVATNMQALTLHLNDFLTQSMSQAQSSINTPVSQQGTAVAPHEQIKMELLSIKPEPFMSTAGLKLEQYSAQIKVHPQELGPITAKIEVNDGVTTITFLTEHAHIKQLMEANLPELRQAFQQSHLQLNTVDIHHGGSQDKKEQPTYVKREDEESVDDKTGKTGRKLTDSHDIKTNRSIIDTYA